MRSDLLFTKLHFPRPRTTLVPRPALMRQLDTYLDGPLTLISASPGSGKTTLFSQWWAELGQARSVGWFSLDERDNNLQIFLSYLLAAFDSLQLRSMEYAKGLLENPQPAPIEALLTAIINDLSSLEQDFVLVLDDYHVITAPEIHQALEFLLEHLPTNMHLAILTRIDPPMPLARLRSRGQLGEIRTQDLRFTTEEAGDFLNEVMNLNISAENVAALEARTEGWISGLQMAALSMRNREDLAGFIPAFTGSHRFVMDYLTDEVLNQQPETVRDFLLETSVLERFNAPLCQAVTGFENPQAILENLENANLFLVPLDDRRQWYRYHHLFSELLRARLCQRDPDAPKVLQVKAAHWYEQNGFLNEAIECALDAGEYGYAAQKITAMVRSMLAFDERDLIKGWLERFPPDQVANHPWLCSAMAMSLTSSGKLEQARQYLDQDLSSLSNGALSETDQRILEKFIAVTRAWIAEKDQDLSTTLELADEAIEQLPPDSPFYLFFSILKGDIHFLHGRLAQAEAAWQEVEKNARQARKASYQIYGLLGLGHLYQWRGQLAKAESFYQAVVEIVEQQQLPLHFRAAAQTGIAQIHWKQNALDQACLLIENVLAIYAASPADYNRSASALTVQARIATAAGELVVAENALRKAEQIFRSARTYPDLLIDYDAACVNLWLVQGNPGKAATWLKNNPRQFADWQGYYAELYGLTRARILVTQNESEELLRQAAELLEILANSAELSHHFGRLVEICIWQALAWHTLGQAQAAARALEKAMVLAEPEMYLSPFVEAGQPLSDLLASLSLQNTNHAGFMGTLIRLGRGKPIQKTCPDLIEPLTEREQDVLRLMAAGLNNPEIAQELYLSLNTVKTHTRGIFGKLGVNNRTQATLRAKELDLI